MRGEERQVGRGERKGTWLEINRNVTIFHQTRGPSPSTPSPLLLCSALRASGVHSGAEHRENGGRELERGGRRGKRGFAGGYACTPLENEAEHAPVRASIRLAADAWPG